MATANAPLDLTDAQRDVVNKLALAMKGVAAVLMLLAAINVAGGVLTLLAGSFVGLLAVIEGVVTGLLALIMLSSAADVSYMVRTPYASIHLGNAFQNLTIFYKSQLFLALFLIVVAVIRLFVG